MNTRKVRHNLPGCRRNWAQRTVKKILCSLGLLLFGAVLAVADDVSLTTYFPIPRGIYNELHTTILKANDTNGPPATYWRWIVKTSDTTLRLQRTDTTGSPTADHLTVAAGGNVGIGKDPTQKLDINGTVLAIEYDCTSPSGCIDAADLEANSVGNSELQNNAVTSNKIADGEVKTADIGDGEVTTNDLQDNSVTAAKVAFNYAGSPSEGGYAYTADKFISNRGNCSAGQFAAGVDEYGAAEGCRNPYEIQVFSAVGSGTTSVAPCPATYPTLVGGSCDWINACLGKTPNTYQGQMRSYNSGNSWVCAGDTTGACGAAPWVQAKAFCRSL